MVKLTLHLDRSLEQNASNYYDKAKKIKKKVEGAKDALQDTFAVLKRLEEKAAKEEQEEKKQEVLKQEWYHKFRWFFTSDGFLVVGGRDATTNEIIIKKHAEKGDVVFHTDMAGSPFFVIKAAGKKVLASSLREVADATVSYSKAWQRGLSTTPVFYVTPEQVSKEAQSGEFLPKGAFMVRGKTTYVENKINLALGMFTDGHIMGGPLEAVKKHCSLYLGIRQGREKTSVIAKKIKKKIKGDLDEIIRAIPAGGAALI